MNTATMLEHFACGTLPLVACVLEKGHLATEPMGPETSAFAYCNVSLSFEIDMMTMRSACGGHACARERATIWSIS